MNNQTKLIIGIIIAALAVAAVAWWATSRSSDNSSGSDEQSAINYEPPTEQEQAQADANKADDADNNGNQVEQSSDDPDQAEDADVVLTRVSVSDSLVTAAGYVDIDQSGTCTLKLTSAAASKSYTNDTEQDPANPSNVNCGSFRIPKSELTAASSWTAQLSYSADGYSGTSQTWDFEL